MRASGRFHVARQLTSESLADSSTNGLRLEGRRPAHSLRADSCEYSWLARTGIHTTPTAIMASTSMRPGARESGTRVTVDRVSTDQPI